MTGVRVNIFPGQTPLLSGTGGKSCSLSISRTRLYSLRADAGVLPWLDSLRALRTDRLDLLLFHCPPDDHEVLARCAELRELGWTRRRARLGTAPRRRHRRLRVRSLTQDRTRGSAHFRLVWFFESRVGSLS